MKTDGRSNDRKLELSRRRLIQTTAVGVAGVLFGSGILPKRSALAQTPSAGKVPAYAATLQPALEQLVGQLLAPGAAVLVQAAELGDWAWTYGTRTLGGSQPVTLSDHVRIGSNTKTMTGTIILQLVDEGKLRLNDPVSKYQSDVPNGANITVEQMLEMRSGLYNYSESVEMNQALDETPTRVWSPDELLAIAFRQPPYFAPGAGYHYSNTNYVLLGLIIEQLTGDSAEAAFQKRIFGPLGLTETLLPALQSNAIPAPHPQGYMYGTNVSTIASAVLPPEQQAQAEAGRLHPSDVTDENPSWGWTAGSAISTADDLARYSRALAGGGLLSSQMQAQRLASMQPTDPANPTGASLGLGLAKIGPLFGFIGDIPGFNSFAGHDPNRDITVITWASLSASPDGRPPAAELGKAIISQLYG
jgi:CubicO group peptidase (beta-lactamase class C family)